MGLKWEKRSFEFEKIIKIILKYLLLHVLNFLLLHVVYYIMNIWLKY